MTIPEENVDDRMINVYINNQLFRYLIACTEKGIVQYSQKDGGKIEHIKKLRNMIDTVIKCTNMRETFKAVCKEVKEYKETIFQKEI